MSVPWSLSIGRNWSERSRRPSVTQRDPRRRSTRTALGVCIVVIVLCLGSNHSGAQTWFAPPITTPIPKEPKALAVGHFNADTFPDVVVGAATGTSESAYIMLGDGTGQLTLDATLAVSNPWWSLAVGDFNGDGRDDIALSETPIKVYYADGNHEYPGPAVAVPTGLGNTNYWQMKAADIDHDGYCDLAGSRSGAPPEGTIYVSWGGPGGLEPGTTNLKVNLVDDLPCVQDHSSIYQYDIEDMDEDGYEDFVLTASYERPEYCQVYRRGVAIWFNSDGRSFDLDPMWLDRSDCNYLDLYYRPSGFTVGSDKVKDVLFMSSTDDSLLVFYGQDSVTWIFGGNVHIRNGDYTVSDYDGDAVVDVVLEGSGSTARVYRGESDGEFSELVPVPGVLSYKKAVDLNGDGRLDLVNANRPAFLVEQRLNIAPAPASVGEDANRSGSIVQVSPSISSGQAVVFSVATDFVEARRLQVLDVAGRTVWQSDPVSPSPSGVVVCIGWDLATTDGRLVESGVYWSRIGDRGPAARVVVIR